LLSERWVIAPRSACDLGPSRGGQDADPEQVGKDRRRDLPGHVDERGDPSRLAVDADSFESAAERLRADRAARRAAWEQPARGWERGSGPVAAVDDQLAEMIVEWLRERDRGLTESNCQMLWIWQ